jgi:FKBP-type peptidyl-prolyl cis-trans isomerase
MIVLASGCQGPQDVSPVAPPGYPSAANKEPAEGEAAQAIGEQAAAQKAASEKKTVETKAEKEEPAPKPIGEAVKTASGLVYEVLKEGTGPVAKSGDKISIHYTGTLTDGSVFDSSRSRGRPFSTAIGVGAVIRGWDEGVPGMKVGERRRLTIPPELGYGSQVSPKIPANSTLIFDVELMGIN